MSTWCVTVRRMFHVFNLTAWTFTQRQLIEDQDDESQDATGDITDEELNELLARSDEEQVVFRKMDLEREAREQSEWFAAGGVGPKPDRLLQLHEIPKFLQAERPFPDVKNEEVIEGRGARVRKDVKYSDGLTDEQFAEVRWATAYSQSSYRSHYFTQALEQDEVDLEGYIEANRKRTGASSKSTPQPEFIDKKRARGRGKGKVSVSRDDSPLPSKRKRVKELSITPSAGDDDDEEDEKPSVGQCLMPSKLNADPLTL